MCIVYVKKQGVTIHKTGQRLVATFKEEKLMELRVLDLDGLVLFGNVQISTQALKLLMGQGINVLFLTQSGQYCGSLVGDSGKNANVKLAQYKAYESNRLNLAKKIVAGKINNEMQVVKRSGWGKTIDRQFFTGLCRQMLTQTGEAESIDKLMGYEGMTAREYYKVYSKGMKYLDFYGRRKHPAPDPVNAMLSLGFTLMTNELVSFLDAAGLDPAVGYLHGTRYGRKSLACDAVEAYRAPVIERLVMTLVNNRRVGEDDFYYKAGEARFKKPRLDDFITGYDQAMEKYRPVMCRDILTLKQDLLSGKEHQPWQLDNATSSPTT